MALELLDSPVRVTWDPDDAALVLVDYGDPMWEPVAVDGQQAVQSAALVRGAGTRNFPRGNENHRLSFTLARITEGPVAAFVARLSASLALPRTMKDVLLSFQDGSHFRLAACAVQSWRHDQEDYLTREGVVILAGRMTADAGTFDPGAAWGDMSFEWQNLG